MGRKAVFLDRDGVLNEDTMYAHKVEHFILLDGVHDALGKLRDAGFIFVIVTNQSGIGRGYYSEDDMHHFNAHLLEILEKEGIPIEKVYHCPHHPEEGCDCRKPKPKFAFDAAKELDIDLSRSYMLGDHKSDVDFGKNAGMRTIYLLTGHGRKHYADDIGPDHVAEDILDASSWILAQEGEA